MHELSDAERVNLDDFLRTRLGQAGALGLKPNPWVFDLERDGRLVRIEILSQVFQSLSHLGLPVAPSLSAIANSVLRYMDTHMSDPAEVRSLFGLTLEVDPSGRWSEDPGLVLNLDIDQGMGRDEPLGDVPGSTRVSLHSVELKMRPARDADTGRPSAPGEPEFSPVSADELRVPDSIEPLRH